MGLHLSCEAIRCSWAGKLREMGLGSIKGVDLKRARELAVEAHALLAVGVDPISARQARRAIPTFGEAADSWMADKAGELRSPKSLERWKRALTVHAAALRDIRVDGVTTEDVLAVLKPIWSVKAETAKMARGYIEQVLNAAKAQGWRTGENPARWAGHMDQLLPKVSRLQRGHHKAMAFETIPALMADLRERESKQCICRVATPPFTGIRRPNGDGSNTYRRGLILMNRRRYGIATRARYWLLI